MENMVICWGNCHCDCDVSPTLSTDLPVCPLPSYGPAVTSCGPDIVTAFVHKEAMVYHGIAYKQICTASPSLYHMWSILLGWESPDQFCQFFVSFFGFTDQFFMQQHSLKRSCHSGVMDCRLAVYRSQC